MTARPATADWPRPLASLCGAEAGTPGLATVGKCVLAELHPSPMSGQNTGGQSSRQLCPVHSPDLREEELAPGSRSAHGPPPWDVKASTLSAHGVLALTLLAEA